MTDTEAMGARGPQPIQIDKDEFEKLVSFQCTNEEIAAFFDVHDDTINNWCMATYGEKLSAVREKKKNFGRVKLKKIQFDLAEKGNASMAIFLGKYLLGQTDEPIDKLILETAQNLGITRDEAVQILQDAAKTKQTSINKKSFEEFCEAAGYPKPFQKQIEMQQFGMQEKEPRILLGSRGYGKTDYVVILGIAYQIYLNPLEETNLIMTKSKERNSAMLNEIAHALRKNNVVLEKENSTSLRVSGLLGKDHSVSAVTVKTVSLRGRHPKRVVMDDPVTEDDTSEATRLNVKKKYNELHKLCPNVLVIGQPAHQHDLYAELRPLLKKMEVPHGSIPELDHDLEAQRLAGVDEASISASYHLKILSEGTTPFDNVRYLDVFPTGESSVAFIDPSHEGGDYTAISIVKAHMQGVAVVGFVWKKAWNHCLDDMLKVLQKYSVRKLCFETNALGDMPIDILRQTFPGLGVVGKRSSTNKHSRIMAAGSFAHMIHLSKDSDPKYIQHVVQYEYKSKYDDAPDSLACCLEWIGLIRGK